MSQEDLLEILYNITNGAGVELMAHNQLYTGEFFLLRHGSSYSEDDEITLEKPVELPSGKSRNTAITFNIKEIQKARVISLGIFKKKRDSDDCVAPGIPSSKSTNGTTNRTPTNTKPGSKVTINRSNIKGSSPDDMRDCESVELQLKTFVIKDETELAILLKLLKEVDVCGITLEGYNVGRFGKVPWVVLTARKTLLPFDIEKLKETTPDIWKVLDKNIFSNDKLCKIMHDSRLAADYLFHKHRIKMVNVFDTQVADVYIKHKREGMTPEKYDPLSDCLQLYNRRIPAEEVEFLRIYEQFNMANSEKWLQKPTPPPEFLKAAAIKVKHLIPLKENMLRRMMEPFSKLVNVHMDSLTCLSVDSYSFAGSSSLTKDFYAALE